MPVNNFSNGGDEPANGDDDYFKKFYTIEQVMAFLRIKKTTFYKYVRENGLKLSGVGHSRRVHQDDLDDFMRGKGK